MRIRRHLRALARRTDGATAIEAAMIMPLFFGMVFSTFEIGFFFYRTATIEAVATDAARLVITGRAPQAGTVEGRDCATGSACFYDTICERVDTFGDCQTQLTVEVRSFETMVEAAAYDVAATCANAAGYEKAAMEYDPGDRNAYAMVRICFNVKSFNPMLGLNMAKNDDGTRSVVAVQIRRNEPFLSNDQINPNEVTG